MRSELVPVLADYLTDRKMQVKIKDTFSRTFSLPGGGPQGTLIGGIEYLIQSNDNADFVEPDVRLKIVDGLSVLELVMLTRLLSEYNFRQRVASDVGIGNFF